MVIKPYLTLFYPPYFETNIIKNALPVFPLPFYLSLSLSICAEIKRIANYRLQNGLLMARNQGQKEGTEIYNNIAPIQAGF
jgi:hypothetical protein